MFSLIMKDLRILKKSMLYVVPIFLVINFIIYKVTLGDYNNVYAYLYSVIFMSYFCFVSMETYKNKWETMIINSFPISRKHIILLKYITLIIYNLFFSVLAVLETILLKLLSIDGGTIADFRILLMSLLISFIYFSIYIPFSTKNLEKTNKVNVIMYILMILLPQIMDKIPKTIIGKNIISFIIKIDNVNGILFFIAIITILIYIISYFISVKIYINKDF
ncbi:ABC-2 transporter permease [Clostridium niameyense]|uniref:ABC-2 transporter permease n=1 Tax=Clostridium niameyense TaxID=1622073 RepID=A0A6M0RB74_9CLOT|nr:ABC-2 transporter permease [Clostridium niameyense]NEZ47007.1 ABC-2 transporter permease [Clostridium niameyense]